MMHTGPFMATKMMFNVPFIIPILMLIMITFFIILKKKPKAGFVMIGALVIGVLAVFTLKFTAPRVVHVQESAYRPVPSEIKGVDYVNIPPVDYQPVAIDDGPGPIWSQGVQSEYEADVYPSQAKAAKALGQQVVKMAIKLNDGVEPKWFEDSMGSSLSGSARQEFRHAVEKYKSNPDNPILTSAKGVEGGVATIGIMLNHFSGTSENILSGTLQASVYVAGKETKIAANFVEKKWMENLSEYVHAQSGKDFVVARSKSSCTDAESANREAMKAAVNIVTARLHQNYDQIVYHVNASDLGNYGIIADRFQQTLTGGITDIYRKAVLLDVSPSKLKLLHSQKTAQAKSDRILEIAGENRSRLTYARLIGSLLGLIGVICGIYLFVNAATKGYYTIMLRIVTIAVIVIGGAVLTLLMFNHTAM